MQRMVVGRKETNETSLKPIKQMEPISLNCIREVQFALTYKEWHWFHVFPEMFLPCCFIWVFIVLSLGQGYFLHVHVGFSNQSRFS